MTYFQSIILGIIQGATEFIPVSSSGHLVIAPFYLGWQIEPREAFVFDVLLQVATLLAVGIYFWEDLSRIGRAWLSSLINRKPWESTDAKIGWYLIIATIPAGIAGLLFKDTFENSFSNPNAAAAFLVGTGLMLLAAENFSERHSELDDLSWIDSLWIGIFQVFALFPGVSRSGSTITGGMLRGLTRKSAARFSFLMAVPVMLAAGTLALYDLFSMENYLNRLPVYLVGFATAAVVGYLSIRWLLNYLSSNRLTVFAVYCLILGLLTLGLQIL
ncbi:MAG: undecaprenyl-diphosphatase UppP [Anaerolineales bacterium]|nr:undecaprenyl-diphosphatase UppP [Anaerolineales bacterium]